MPTTRSRTCVRKSSKAITPVKSKTSQPLQCAICLDNISNRGKLPTCHHYFCFVCIHEWSKVCSSFVHALRFNNFPADIQDVLCVYVTDSVL